MDEIRSEEHLIPIIRVNLAQKLVREGFRAKEIADALNVTQPAVTQYLKGKRGRKSSRALNHIDVIIDPLAEKLVKRIRFWSWRTGDHGDLGDSTAIDGHK